MVYGDRNFDRHKKTSQREGSAAINGEKTLQIAAPKRKNKDDRRASNDD